MHIVIAPDSYKESLTALQVAESIQRGFSEEFPQAQYTLVPIADGGEGSVDAVIEAMQGQSIEKIVRSPLGSFVNAKYGITGDGKTAVIEMSAASGLMLVPIDKRNPLMTTSYGTGELIADALDKGIKHIILGLGGSATNDGGIGMMQALGVEFYDHNDTPLPYGAMGLQNLKRIDTSHIHPKINHCHFEIACDVDTVLTGNNGASRIFGPQKGASEEDIEILDQALSRYADVLKDQLDLDVASIHGGGAAGGMGAAAFSFLKGVLRPGVDIILELIDFKSIIEGADLVITGEGRIDEQTIFGKAPIGIAKIAKTQNIPVIGIAGSLGQGAELTGLHGIDAVFSIVNRPCSIEEAYRETADNLVMTARNIAKLLLMGNRLTL